MSANSLARKQSSNKMSHLTILPVLLAYKWQRLKYYLADTSVVLNVVNSILHILHTNCWENLGGIIMKVNYSACYICSLDMRFLSPGHVEKIYFTVEASMLSFFCKQMQIVNLM